MAIFIEVQKNLVEIFNFQNSDEILITSKKSLESFIEKISPRKTYDFGHEEISGILFIERIKMAFAEAFSWQRGHRGVFIHYESGRIIESNKLFRNAGERHQYLIEKYDEEGWISLEGTEMFVENPKFFYYEAAS